MFNTAPCRTVGRQHRDGKLLNALQFMNLAQVAVKVWEITPAHEQPGILVNRFRRSGATYRDIDGAALTTSLDGRRRVRMSGT